LVRRLFPQEWEQAPGFALENALMAAIRRLDGDFSESNVARLTSQEAALLLYNLDGTEAGIDIQPIHLKGGTKRYSQILARLKGESNFMGHGSTIRRHISSLREALAYALVGLDVLPSSASGTTSTTTPTGNNDQTPLKGIAVGPGPSQVLNTSHGSRDLPSSQRTLVPEVDELKPSTADNKMVSRDSKPQSDPALRLGVATTSLVDRIARRIGIEAHALGKLARRAAKRLKKHPMRYLMASALLSVLGIVSTAVEVQWFEPYRTISRILQEYGILVSIGPVLPVIALLAAERRRTRRIAVYSSVALVLLYSALLGVTYWAQARETDAYQSAIEEAQRWSQQQSTDQDARGSFFTYDNKCRQASTEESPFEAELASRKPNFMTDIELTAANARYRYGKGIERGETNLNGCDKVDNSVVLSTLDMVNAFPADEGRSQSDPFFAQVMFRPLKGTSWADCSLAIVPPARSKVVAIPNFGLEYDASARGYRPIVFLTAGRMRGVSSDDKTVARSAITLPYGDRGTFLNSPGEGWLMVSVLRTGQTYRVYFNERLAVTYDWYDGDPFVHLSIQARPYRGASEGAFSYCQFTNFKYWIEPSS
jgi:hypothetical protein